MDKDKLFELYKIAIDEYRFQVQYNWERNRFYLSLTAGIVSVAAGLLKLPGAKQIEFVLIPLFAIGCIIAVMGFQTLTKGHEYYRRTVIKTSYLATELGISLQEQPIATTEGQREAKFTLKDTEGFINRPFRLGTINYYLATVFILAGTVHVIGIIFVFIDLKFT